MAHDHYSPGVFFVCPNGQPAGRLKRGRTTPGGSLSAEFPEESTMEV